MTKTVLVCGGRDFDDWYKLNHILLHYDVQYATRIITGDANGADWLARAWAKFEGLDYTGYPANWKAHGRAAGAIRNQQMLDKGKPDLVIAFPGGKGTADMVARSKKAKVEVLEVD